MSLDKRLIDSHKLAEDFGKSHKHILEIIRSNTRDFSDSFVSQNFKFSDGLVRMTIAGYTAIAMTLSGEKSREQQLGFSKKLL